MAKKKVGKKSSKKSAKKSTAKKASKKSTKKASKKTAKKSARGASTMKRSAKKSAPKKTAKRSSKKSARRASGKRELIDTGTDKRYVRRDAEGQFKESDDVGRSLAADIRQHSSTSAGPGQGDRGDRPSSSESAD